jgi:hypothetical protein
MSILAPPRRWCRGLLYLLAAVLLTAVSLSGLGSLPAHAAGALISQGKMATASSTENSGTPASAGVDGDTGTRWSSQFSDPQWIEVDLGASATINQVVLNWETAYAKAFQIQTSADNSTWTTVYSTTNGTGDVQTLNLTGTGRYVRMYGTARATQWGCSLWEFQVYGTFSGGGGSGPGAPPDSFWGDTSTIPAAQNVLTVQVLNRTNGKYPDSQVYWNFNGQPTP